MDSRGREIVRIGQKMFSDKRELDSLWQELALWFYPERANFTTERSLGDEFSDHLYASYTALARRELGNLMSTNLRPQSSKWFNIGISGWEIEEGTAEQQFLEFLRDIQWKAMYDRGTNFVRATKESDHDFATFGNNVIDVTPNARLDGLLYRCRHLRDCAWSENAEGKVDVLFYRGKMTARQLIEKFGGRCSKDVHKAYPTDPEKLFDVFHCVMPARLYQNTKRNGDEWVYTSFFVEVASETVLEQTGMPYFRYVVPRWQTVSDSQYGRSMATCVSLPDGRTLQVVTRTLREAAEKYVDPPMIAVGDAIRGDIPLYAGGITIADMEYNEKLGEVLRPVTQNPSSWPIGEQIAAALRDDLRHGFFLDKITLPDPTNTDMTAFEVRRRLEEHLKSASPIFEPIEKDYNAPLCEVTFEILQLYGAFPMNEMPQSLNDADIEFNFQSPLSEAADQKDAAVFVDGLTRILGPVASVDPSQIANADMTKGTRDALRAVGWKADWLAPIEKVEEQQEQLKQMQNTQAMLEQSGTAAQVGEQAGKAAQAIQGAGVTDADAGAV